MKLLYREKGHNVYNILGFKIKFKRKFDVKEFQQINIEPVERIQDNAITICFSSNNFFFEYLAVCIYSLVKYSDKNKFYDIVILEKDITELNKEKLKELSKNNISIRFYNISDIIENLDLNFTINHHFSIENYFRLFIPDIFKHYEKVLYLDCDGIFRQDVAQIYEIQMQEYPLAAAKDFIVQNQIYSNILTDYYYKELAMQNPLKYINTGVLLMNIPLLLKDNFLIKALELISRFTPKYVDQCIINKLYENRIKFIDNRYNATAVLKLLASYNRISLNLPDNIMIKYKESIDSPVFMHFMTGLKPWRNPEVKWSDFFWELAKEAGYYERILYKNLR